MVKERKREGRKKGRRRKNGKAGDARKGGWVNGLLGK